MKGYRTDGSEGGLGECARNRFRIIGSIVQFGFLRDVSAPIRSAQSENITDNVGR